MHDLRRTAIDALAFVAIIGAAVWLTGEFVYAVADQPAILSLGAKG